MAEQDHETHQRQCEKIWTQDIKRLEERFMFTDKALEVQSKEIERRMHEANNLKKELSGEINNLKLHVTTLEAKSDLWFNAIEAKTALWFRILGFGLGALQIIVVIVMKVLP